MRILSCSEQWQYVAFTIEHIIPIAKNGADTLDNLALACFHCNRKKSDRTTAIDPQSGAEVPLCKLRIKTDLVSTPHPTQIQQKTW